MHQLHYSGMTAWGYRMFFLETIQMKITPEIPFIHLLACTVKHKEQLISLKS